MPRRGAEGEREPVDRPFFKGRVGRFCEPLFLSVVQDTPHRFGNREKYASRRSVLEGAVGHVGLRHFHNQLLTHAQIEREIAAHETVQRPSMDD